MKNLITSGFRVLKISHILILTVLIGVLTAQPAHAYIDPGSGSALLAAAIGFFVAIGIAVKSFWYKITGLFGKGRSSSDDEK